MAAINKSTKNKDKLDNAELALKCAQFFMELGESCLEIYHKFKKGPYKKTKIIKKTENQLKSIAERASKEINNKSRKQAKTGPKKPLSAYIIFYQQKKQSYGQKFPNLSVLELTKLVAKQWNDMTPQQKDPYLSRAQNGRNLYQNQRIFAKNQVLLKKQQQKQENEYNNNPHLNININTSNNHQQNGGNSCIESVNNPYSNEIELNPDYQHANQNAEQEEQHKEQQKVMNSQHINLSYHQPHGKEIDQANDTNNYGHGNNGNQDENEDNSDYEDQCNENENENQNQNENQNENSQQHQQLNGELQLSYEQAQQMSEVDDENEQQQERKNQD